MSLSPLYTAWVRGYSSLGGVGLGESSGEVFSGCGLSQNGPADNAVRNIHVSIASNTTYGYFFWLNLAPGEVLRSATHFGKRSIPQHNSRCYSWFFFRWARDAPVCSLRGLPKTLLHNKVPLLTPLLEGLLALEGRPTAL